MYHDHLVNDASGFLFGSASIRCALLAATLWLAEQHMFWFVQRYRIRLQEVTCGPPFGRAVYMRCCMDDATMQAGKLARQAFGHPFESHYIPHLTMLYSRLPMEAM
jgi:hypothetical protein